MVQRRVLRACPKTINRDAKVRRRGRREGPTKDGDQALHEERVRSTTPGERL